MSCNFISNTNVFNNWKPEIDGLYKVNNKILKCVEDKGNDFYTMMLLDDDDAEIDKGGSLEPQLVYGWLIDSKVIPIYSLDESDINESRYKKLKNILNDKTSKI